MNVPHLLKIDELLDWIHSVAGQRPDGSWGPIRPVPLWGLCLRRRLSLAWRVFKGEVDVVEWEQ
jgi:hypothetical protein